MLRFVFNLLVFCIPAAMAALWSLHLSRTSRDEWKLFVWFPVVPLVAWAVFIAVGVTRDATSHNLWPFELAAIALLSLALFGVVLLLRRLVTRSSSDWSIRRDRDLTADSPLDGPLPGHRRK